MAVKQKKYSLETLVPYRLIGIVSDENDYKLCWKINNALKINLVHKTSDNNLFDDYFIDFHEDYSYKLIKNKQSEKWLIPELNKVHYFLHIIGEMNETEYLEIIKVLRQIPHIIFVTSIDFTKFKSKQKIFN